jgi:hypothetical protein
VQLSIHDTSLTRGVVAYIPVYVDSNLTGLNITAYQLTISYSSSAIQIDSAYSTGTLTASWGNPTFNATSGEIRVAGASATALSGTGILLLLKVSEPTGDTGTYSPLTFTSAMLNDGTPRDTTVNGYITIYDGVPSAPVLNTPPNGAIDQPVVTTLTWFGSGANTLSYHIQVASDSLFTHIVFDSSGIFGDSANTPPLQPLEKYFWRVAGKNPIGESPWSTVWSFTTMEGLGVKQSKNELPQEFALDQNYPNPFNPSTTIGFSLPSAGYVSLKIYNTLGVEVSTLISGEIQPGNYTTDWNASKFPSGIYYCRISVNGLAPAGKGVQSFTKVMKMAIIK